MASLPSSSFFRPDWGPTEHTRRWPAFLLAASSDPTGAQQSNREMASLPSSGHLHAGAITPELWHQLAISFLWTRQGLLAHHALLQKLATESMQAHLPVLCETVGYKPAIGIRGPPGGVGTAAPHTTAAAVNAPKGEEKIPNRKIPSAKTPALREEGGSRESPTPPPRECAR